MPFSVFILVDSDVFMFLQKIRRKQVVPAIICLLFFVQTISAQEKTALQNKGSNVAWRIGFWEILHQTFNIDTSHPFYQMTGTNRFKGGKGFFGATTFDFGQNNFLPNISKKNNDGHGSKDGLLTKLFGKIPLLKGLPSFSLEYILPTDFIVGIGVAFAYTNIWLDDTEVRAATSGADPDYSTPLLHLASHFYMFSTTIHPFGVPRVNDLDLFFGLGLSRVESTLRYGIHKIPTVIYDSFGIEHSTQEQTELYSSSGIMTFRRLGIATGGDSFGFMLEFLFPGKNKFLDNPFESNTVIDSSIFESTYNDRGSALPSKVGMSGGITRLSWTYSF